VSNVRISDPGQSTAAMAIVRLFTEPLLPWREATGGAA